MMNPRVLEAKFSMKAGSAAHSALWSQSVCHLKGVYRKWLMQVGMLPARGSLETYKGLFRGTPASQSSFNTPLWGKHSGNKALNQPTPGPATRPECPHQLKSLGDLQSLDVFSAWMRFNLEMLFHCTA